MMTTTAQGALATVHPTQDDDLHQLMHDTKAEMIFGRAMHMNYSTGLYSFLLFPIRPTVNARFEYDDETVFLYFIDSNNPEFSADDVTQDEWKLVRDTLRNFIRTHREQVTNFLRKTTSIH
jgi:hypothetical protein